MNSNNKRIAKNTLFLYVRMMFLMFITLFTSRVVLEKLGIEDFGIYNVVGGLAMMFTFFSSSLTNATQRFLNIELGRKNLEGAKFVFNQHLIIYLIIILIVIVLSETVGLWFVLNKLQIPPERLSAALWVYQFTIISLSVTLIGIVFNSMIIAHEDMKIYSYVGILDGLLKLAIAYAISMFPLDRLITYSLFLLTSTILIQGCYACYCLKNYEESKLHFVWNKKSIKETFSFISWNVLSTAIYATKDQGTNILLNIYFGPVVNAARAVAFQVNSAVSNFGGNFFTSIKPQIIKSYSNGNMEYLNKLFFFSSKFSLLLMWIIVLPVIMCIDTLLNLWLVDVPPQTDVFVMWILADSMLAILTNPTWSITLAVGKLKKYILIGNGCLLLILPVSMLCILMGKGAESIFIITFIVRIIQVICVLLITKEFIHFPLIKYFREVVLPLLYVILLTVPFMCFIKLHFYNSFLTILIYSILINIIAIWFVGLNIKEREGVFSIIKKYFETFNKQ